MPITGLKHRNHETVPENSTTMGLGHINTTSFLFGDDDENAKDSTTSPDVKSYLQMNATDDKFPILVRRNEFPGVVGDRGCIESTIMLTAFCSSLHLLLP